MVCRSKNGEVPDAAGRWECETMRSTKSQNIPAGTPGGAKHKQILITKIINSKHDIANPFLFGSLDIGILNLFDICLLVLVICAGRQRWFADRRTAKFLMRLEDGNVKQ